MPNIVQNPIVNREKIAFSPLHIHFGLMKQFVEALDSDGECFQHIAFAFTKLSFDKIKVGIFNKSQICTPVRNEEFINKMNNKEKAAWLVFVAVTRNFLGNKKADNSHFLVTTMLLAYRNLGCKMSIKLHFFHSHLDEVPVTQGLLVMNGFIKTS